MRTEIFTRYSSLLKEQISATPLEYAKSDRAIGAMSALPIAIVCVAIDLLEQPLTAVESVALAIANLVGAIFLRDFSFDDGMFNLARAFFRTGYFIGKIVYAPIEIFEITQRYLVSVKKIAIREETARLAHTSSEELFSPVWS